MKAAVTYENGEVFRQSMNTIIFPIDGGKATRFIDYARYTI